MRKFRVSRREGDKWNDRMFPLFRMNNSELNWLEQYLECLRLKHISKKQIDIFLCHKAGGSDEEIAKAFGLGRSRIATVINRVKRHLEHR